MKKNTIIILLVLLLVLSGYFLARQDKSLAEQRARADSTESYIATLEDTVSRLKAQDELLSNQYDDDTTEANATINRFRIMIANMKPKIIYRDGRVDTIPGAPINIGDLADSADAAIKSCKAAMTTCEQRVAVKDSIITVRETQVDSAKSLAKQWEKIAKGPFIRSAVELTLATRDWSPVAAAEVTLGRSRLKVLGRLVVAQATETCSFAPNVEAYSCSQPIEATGLIGLRYGF